MFLDWIQVLGFLTKTDEEGIFLDFPVAVRRIIGKEVTEVLLKNQISPASLRSAAHVRVMLECVGQSFALPVEHHEVITAATELYKRWVFEADSRPPPFAEDPELFVMEILKHWSLIFVPRANLSKELLNTQVRLCESVLEGYIRLARLGEQMSVYLWERLLEIIMSLSDSLLKRKQDEEPLADRLAPLLLRVVFEAFLRSSSRNDSLWDGLKILMEDWRHRRPTVMQWNTMCTGLLSRVMRVLYGPSVGNDLVVFVYDDNAPATSIPLADEYCLYVWGRIMHIMTDLETIPNPPNYHEAMKSVASMTTTLLNLRSPPVGSSSFRLPDGNSMLKMLGHWLFASTNHFRPGYDRGKSVALIALTQLICAKANTKFVPRYLAYLYRGLDECLRARSPLMLATAVENLTMFFQIELPSCHVVVPSALVAIERVLTEAATHNAIQLRRAAIRMLNALFCLPNVYHRAEFLPVVSSNAPVFRTYNDLPDRSNKILLEAMRVENDPENQQMLLCTLFLHGMEHLNYSTSMPHLLIQTILEKIWVIPLESVTCALQVLSCLARTYHLYKKPDHADMEISSTVVVELCKYVERFHTASAKKLEDEIVCEAMACITEWMLIHTLWLLRYPRVLLQVLGLIDLELNGKKPTHHSPTLKTKEAAEMMLVHLLCNLGQFPAPSVGHSSCSSLQKENDLMTADSLTAKNVQCFVVDKTLLSVISYPRKDSIEVAIVLRDQAGRFVWRGNLNLFPPEIVPAADPPGDQPLVLPQPLPLQEADEEFIAELLSFLDETQKRSHDAIRKQAADRAAIEEQHLRNSSYGLTTDVSVHRPASNPYDPTRYDPVPTRLLLSHLGYLTLDARSHFQLLQASTARPFNFLQNYKSLDQIAGRECYSASVLYVAKGHAKGDVWDNMDGSAAYSELLKGLGWEVEVVAHNGHLAGLDPAQTGDVSLYWSSFCLELMYHVGTLMPSNEHKKRLVNSDAVVVTWVESLDDYDANSFLGPEQHLNIALSPLQSGLVRVRLYRKTPSLLPSYLAPLHNEMVISQHILPYAVRETVLHACRILRPNSGNKPLTQRRNLIDDAVKRHTVQVPVSKFYASQFTQI